MSGWSGLPCSEKCKCVCVWDNRIGVCLWHVCTVRGGSMRKMFIENVYDICAVCVCHCYNHYIHAVNIFL